MTFILFIGWVLVVFMVSDLVGSALRLGLVASSAGAAPRQAPGESEPVSPLDFVHSTLLGFSVLWVVLSGAYALGVATQPAIVSVLGCSALAAAAVLRGSALGWARSRMRFWLLLALVAVLASCVTPTFEENDDPEYFFFIDKLLETGSVTEYFSGRRPITLGGWTFLQAVFSAGPAGVSYVASLDAVVGSILFLFGALLLGMGFWTAPVAALTATLVVQPFQLNLGTALAMSGMSALLISLSLPNSSLRSFFIPFGLSVMAVTMRPQIALIAFVAAAFALWQNRDRSWIALGAALLVIPSLWILIFYNDTGLLPLSSAAGYNPHYGQIFHEQPLSLSWLLSQVVVLWQEQTPVITVTFLAILACVGQSVAGRHATVRTEFRVLGAFSIAAAATVVIMIAKIGPLGVNLRRYYIPIIDAFLYVFLIRSCIHVYRNRLVRLLRFEALPLVVTSAALVMAMVLQQEVPFEGRAGAKLSLPAESSGRICAPVLTPEERRAVEQLSAGNGFVPAAMDCLVGSFPITPKLMMSDLFASTHGDYFDIDWDVEKILTWLRKQDIDKLVYLENDVTSNFGAAQFQHRLKELKPQSPEINGSPENTVSPEVAQFIGGYTYALKGIEIHKKLAEYCRSKRMPIRDAQGPLVIVDVKDCRRNEASTTHPLTGKAL